jgi:ribonucleoside-diphosphate reductase beta chain
MNLLSKRQTYKPFIYEKAYEYWMKQQNVHWLHSEIAMSSDLQDWKLDLSETEKDVVGGVLKGFVQTEIVVNDYWTRLVGKWFRHPEIVMMASCFGNMETIHTVAYAYLNDSLGLHDYDAFLQEPTAKAKIDRLLLINDEDGKDEIGESYRRDIARSLAIFSGFTEGVSLFSSFAILLNFSRFNKLKGIGQIISFSIRDESLHSEAGCWLFRQFINENQDLWTDDLKKEIYNAARITVALEDSFIDKVFEKGNVEGIDPKDLKQFIRHRANVKLGDLGLKTNWKNIDQEALSRMSWFDFLSSGVESQDFFAQRVSDYSKGNIDFDNIF